MSNKFILLIGICLICMNYSCSIKTFNEREYDAINLLKANTGDEYSPINAILKKNSSLEDDEISAVKAWVGEFSECLIEEGNLRVISLSYKPEVYPCLGNPVGYQRYRLFELITLRNNRLYFFLSEKLNSQKLYERSLIYYFIPKKEDDTQVTGNQYTFNRSIRRYKGMMSEKMKFSRSKKDEYIFELQNRSGDQSREIHKIISLATNKISGTKPLVYDITKIFFKNDTINKDRGIPLIYDAETSQRILFALSGSKMRSKKN